jgi:hypothetical protein
MKITKIAALPLTVFALACSSHEEPKTVATGASCSSLEGSQETLAELYKPGTIYRADPIEETVFHARASTPVYVMGASLKVRAEPGMSAPYMQRVLACHAASGGAVHPNDPLFPKSGTLAKLSVEESKFGFAINVVGDSRKTGEEILKRAETLTGQGANVDVQQVSNLSRTSSL